MYPEPEILNVSGSICKTNVDEIAYASLVFEKKIIAKIGAAIRFTNEKSNINNWY